MVKQHEASDSVSRREGLRCSTAPVSSQALRLHLTLLRMLPLPQTQPAGPPNTATYNAPGVQEFCESHPELVRFQLWLQWIADRQLSGVAKAASGIGP